MWQQSINDTRMKYMVKAPRLDSTRQDPARQRLIVKLPKPKDLESQDEYAISTTATSEDEETRRRALYKIPLIKSKTPHTDLAELQKEGLKSKADDRTPHHPPTPHDETQQLLDPPNKTQRQLPAQPTTNQTTSTHHTRRDCNRHSRETTTSRRSSIGTGTDPHDYRERNTHSVDITYSRDSTKVVLHNATGEWRTTIRDRNALMADHIPSRDPVDINLRLDPYQTSTSTSFAAGHVGMPGRPTGYGTLDTAPDQPMHVSPPVPAAHVEPAEETLYDHNCQG